MDLTEHITGLPGFKISDTHFRLGSKIHISEFYYAKGFFQNSFFASRLAFMVTKEILEKHSSVLDRIDPDPQQKGDGLTLIGYGLYSELLLSLVEKFLRPYIPGEKINHDLISDVEKPTFIKDYGDTYRNILLIIPIASTFSTAIKIEEYLNSRFDRKEILLPYLNVLHISHAPDQEPLEELKPIEKAYGFVNKNIANKTIEVQALFSETPQTREQQYFLTLPSLWEHIDDCNRCFPTEPDELLDEKPLFLTDKTSVTPDLVFERPEARTLEFPDTIEKFKLSNETLKYGHLERDGKHFHYYLKIETFFTENFEGITNWLTKLKSGDHEFYRSFQNKFKETDRVLLIAPGHYSNTGFVHAVNQYLFANSASIIHYNTRKDNIQNFGLIYGTEIEHSDTKVVFVDDTITTGRTFRRANYFLQHSQKDRRGFDACIVLIDRSDSFTHQNIQAKLDGYFAYANLHLPSLGVAGGECPLCLETKKYDLLAENSFLDRMKIHFLEQKNKLSHKPIHNGNTSPAERNPDYKEERYLARLEAVHRIYDWCSNTSHHFDMSFQAWKEHLLEYTNSPFTGSFLANDSNDDDELSDETATILKVLTLPPFTNHKPIKEASFKWALRMLDEQIGRLKDQIRKGELKHETFRDFKFLVRRAGLLNTNYLVSNHIFDSLKTLYSSEGLSKLKGELENEAPSLSRNLKLQNVNDFHVFYGAQLSELLFMNEARSIHLEITLSALLEEDPLTLPPDYRQLLRFIREENGILIQRFWDFLEGEESLVGETIGEDLIEEKVRETLEKLENHYRSKTLRNFLEVSTPSRPLHENKQLINYLAIKVFLKLESEGGLAKDDLLSVKTEIILDRMTEIVRQEDQGSGAFFMVRYKHQKKSKNFVAYNKGDSGGLRESFLDNNAYLNSFLDGSSKEAGCKTIIEFHKREHDNKWVDLYATNSDPQPDYFEANDLPKGYNRLLIIRFSKVHTKEDEEEIRNHGQALAGFYFKRESDDLLPTEVDRTRYLLLLRSSVSSFIESHHENDEFKDWMEADNKKRTALLTGHGRQMLMDIASRKLEYRGIISTILMVQRLILDFREEKAFKLDQNTGGDINNVKGVFRQLFNPNSDVIDNHYIKHLEQMAYDVFAFEEVENAISEKEVQITHNAPDQSDFRFSKDILDMICFELFINAKKNRWIFTDHDQFTFNPLVNKVEITGEIKDDNYLLQISNTGPMLLEREETISKLNDNGEVKRYRSVAGLKLIHTLFREFDLGEITFEQKEPIEGLLCRFIVTLELKNWSNG